jgi:hypothetical protein
LVQWIRDKTELKRLKATLPKIGLSILPLSENINQQSCQLKDGFKLSSGLEVQDALIAATVSQDTLYTGNLKHFKDLGIKVEAFSI